MVLLCEPGSVEIEVRRRYDGFTGLYAFGRRDYSPALGRWMEQDPEKKKGSG